MKQRFIAVVVVLFAAPFVMSLARASFAPPPVTAPAVTRELAAMAEPVALGRRYGVAVVEMPAPPTADNRQPTAETFRCPEVRAIVSGDSRFAILAWDDASHLAAPGMSLVSPAGPVTVRRVGTRSVSLSHDDITLNCQLSMR